MSAPGEAGSGGGPTDPNEALDDERARGEAATHRANLADISEAANKGAPEVEPFKITNAG